MRYPSRPVYLNLFKIHLPLPGWVSILQRMSGAVLFLVTPLLLYLLQISFDVDGYTRLREWLHMPVVKVLSTLLLWIYLQHLLGGVRFLLLDIHVGTALTMARKLSAVTLLASSLLTLVIAGRWLW
ncbi:succinate dehydrogenase cytochrome b-556 subunit [Sulfuriferula multivorans]|uniref:Succinate dehydrogenase cytochrome b556 subunit n=1 Tax=Sulfuriferula multivorans TaxID=1559896 RepID=A0A401JHN6_9PROT|nr:succinate dehydrogenase, cytochrome b556 subunit [Sulfuriferula multivorans]GBL47499.1 succinate dehydrogenase cytochrome b-556 subunit [Sulfuriferula multivorans]